MIWKVARINSLKYIGKKYEIGLVYVIESSIKQQRTILDECKLSMTFVYTIINGRMKQH